MLGPDALTDFETIKRRLPNIEETDQDEIEDLINSASCQANIYAHGRKLKAREYELTLDGSGWNYLILSQYPINSITRVCIDPLRFFGEDTIVTDYLNYPEEGMLYRDTRWPAGKQNIQITFNAGFAEVPADLRDAVIEVVSYNLKRFRSGLLGLKSVVGDGVTTSYELTIPVNAQRVFESYADKRI